jgi:homoserine kinase
MPMLLECAMAGELAGCGAVHPDNVTPSLYGGFILARSAQPPDIVRLPVPDGLACAVLHPRMEIETGASRRLIGDQVLLKDATRQWANVGGLVAALYTSDLALLSRSLVDHIAEPKRASLVPGLAEIKTAAMSAGALGCSLSGSGPSIFALAATLDIAARRGDEARSTRERRRCGYAVGREGARVITRGLRYLRTRIERIAGSCRSPIARSIRSEIWRFRNPPVRDPKWSRCCGGLWTEMICVSTAIGAACFI